MGPMKYDLNKQLITLNVITLCSFYCNWFDQAIHANNSSINSFWPESSGSSLVSSDTGKDRQVVSLQCEVPTFGRKLRILHPVRIGLSHHRDPLVALLGTHLDSERRNSNFENNLTCWMVKRRIYFCWIGAIPRS